MMENKVPLPEELRQKNRELAARLSEPWEKYAKSVNRLSRVMRKAGIDTKLLRDVIDATITLYGI